MEEVGDIPEGKHLNRYDLDKPYAPDNWYLGDKKFYKPHTKYNFPAPRLRSCYNKQRKNNSLCQEWAEDFKLMVNEIGLDIPEGMYLARYDMEKPFSKDNWFFSEKRQSPKRKEINGNAQN